MSDFAQKKPALRLEWDFGPDAPPGVDRLLPLLAAIGTSGSIAGAARETGLSYRNAWGLINAWQLHFGQPLIATARASGSTLEDFALQWLAIDRNARQSLAPVLDQASQPMRTLASQPAERAGTTLRIAASHDPLLNELVRQLRRTRPAQRHAEHARQSGIADDAGRAALRHRRLPLPGRRTRARHLGALSRAARSAAPASARFCAPHAGAHPRPRQSEGHHRTGRPVAQRPALRASSARRRHEAGVRSARTSGRPRHPDTERGTRKSTRMPPSLR
jgi:molybdenum-dependent DNA-binding transcriptional regulator ModE